VRVNLKLVNKTNIPNIAPGDPFTPPGGYYESGNARLKINGVEYTIGYLFGNRSGYNYVNSAITPTFHDSSFMGQVNYYYKEVNYPGRSSFEIYLPLELKSWFESYYY